MSVEEVHEEYDIVMESVYKEFGGEAVVVDASLTVKKGEIFGFVGPSGSGKTTTVRMLTGVYAPTKGRVEVLGQEPARFTRRGREKIGYLPQQFVLYPNLSVLENMRFVASMYGLTPWRRRKPIQDALEFVQIWDARKKLASQLSGGMLRRLELAAALAHNPQLIFADEPTAGIDPVLRERLWQGFKTLREEGRTLFVTTQYVTEAEYCDHVALMAEGRIVANDTPEGLRRLAIGGEAIDIQASDLTADLVGLLQQTDGIRLVETKGFDSLRVYVDDASALLPAVVNAIQSHDCVIRSVEEYRPTFDEVFILLLQQSRETSQAATDQVRAAAEVEQEEKVISQEA